MLLEDKGFQMVSVIDEEFLTLRDESNRLWKIKQSKFDEWQKLASQASSPKEFEATRPIFDEAMKAHKNWQDHISKNRPKLFLEEIEDY